MNYLYDRLKNLLSCFTFTIFKVLIFILCFAFIGFFHSNATYSDFLNIWCGIFSSIYKKLFIVYINNMYIMSFCILFLFIFFLYFYIKKKINIILCQN